jgi:hypothetical protein
LSGAKVGVFAFGPGPQPKKPDHGSGPPLGAAKKASRQTPGGYVPTSTNEGSYIILLKADKSRPSTGRVIIIAVRFTLSLFLAGAPGPL